MYSLPDLPYDYEALAPLMSSETLHIHHDRHHKTYVDNTNAQAGAAGLDGLPMEEVARQAWAKGEKKLFNNAAQSYNHAFFWESMTPSKAAPTGDLKAAIDKAFGGLDALKDAFVNEGIGHFASGWVWLVNSADGLKVISTHDAESTLIREGLTPLLVCDVWEHAYYVDHRNDRKTFITKWFEELANWAFAAKQLAGDAYVYPKPT